MLRVVYLFVILLAADGNCWGKNQAIWRCFSSIWQLAGAQLQAELFGLLAPGMPEEAVRRGRYFARVTNSGLAVEDGVCIILFE